MAQSARAWVARRVAMLLLLVTAAGLAAGGVARLAGAGQAADAVWLGVAVCGMAYACWIAAAAIARGRLSVDVIALLALAGAIAVDELLAAAVISVMLASGRALEDWAAYRARHDLSALLARTPRIARRYRDDGSPETVPLDEIAAGDLLLVAAGDVVPVDGTLVADAVLDESALTGEALPVQHARGDTLRSGTVNAAGPFGLRATTSAADSTYAGIVRRRGNHRRRQTMSKRTRAAAFGAAATALAAGLGAYPVFFRRWCLTWGARPDEVSGKLPGDELLPRAGIVVTRAITIEAPPGAIWPWLVQMGSGRGGVYTYDWIENLFGLDMHSTRRILPQYQGAKVGDEFPLGPGRPAMRVAVLDPGRTFTLRFADGNWVWIFALSAEDGHTRLISRNRIAAAEAWPARLFGMLVMEPGSLIMERKMLLGIKERAENLAREQAT